MCAAGSSPLARGLQAPRLRRHRPPGIIPARAGFTWASPTCGSRTWDYPRSRGVYELTCELALSVHGSSPLARGLHCRPPRLRARPGIIPARAGFTGWGAGLRSSFGDHPRSRGVYSATAGCRAEVAGSSPLARGLRAVAEVVARCRGIIPARAGFTIVVLCDHRPAGDHPRSRGVYIWQTEIQYNRTWIIPARAGFTPHHSNTTPQVPDHPRSRGVYAHTRVMGIAWEGSSPLARGLLPVVPLQDALLGIIPARAGFTGRPTLLAGPGWDHPRSRGVYRRGESCGRWRRGSSPLARGLPFWNQELPGSMGIIPARAGFTLGDRRDSNGGPPYQGAFAFTGDLGTARLSCGSVVAGQRSTTTPSPV